MIRVELRSWSRYGTLFNWTNIGVSFVLLTVNLFRHPTLIEHGGRQVSGLLSNCKQSITLLSRLVGTTVRVVKGHSKIKSLSASIFCRKCLQIV